MDLHHPLFIDYLTRFAKKEDFGNPSCLIFGDLVLSYSSNNTVFCLHGFVRVSKNHVGGGLPVVWKSIIVF